MQCEDEGLILIPQYEYALSFWLWEDIKLEESQRKYTSLVITSADEKECNKSRAVMDCSNVHGQSTEPCISQRLGGLKQFHQLCDLSMTGVNRFMDRSLLLRMQTPS